MQKTIKHTSTLQREKTSIPSAAMAKTEKFLLRCCKVWTLEGVKLRIRTLPKNSDKEDETDEETQRRPRRKARRRAEEERESGLRLEPLMLQRGSTVPAILTDSAAILSSLSLSLSLSLALK